MSRDGEQTRREGPSETTDSRELTTPRSDVLGADPALDEATRTMDGEDGPTSKSFPIDNWSRYEHVAFIGRGGMGTVYKARDPQLSRFVALKFLSRTEGARAKKFIAEARSQARVEHEHVCKVYEVGTAQGVPYIAMQFIDGITLSKAQDEMTVEDKVHVMRKVADAVQAAHEGGLIHRDLKRSNIMVERDGNRWQPFVLDFGIAREVDAGATLAGEVAGTPAYMAPEQARGERADKRTDVWGLGATLYALLAGRPPNQGTTAEAFASLVTKDVPSIRTVVPRLPGELATIVMKCLETDPDRRYQSAAEVSNDLRRYLAGEPIAARPKSLAYRASKRLRRSWAIAAAAGVTVCALVAVGLLWSRATAQNRLAEKRVKIAQRFGQEVARIETLMRQAYAAPLHDTRREKQQVLARMAALEKEAKELGDAATGPAEYAVGRGHLSLHDYAKARTHLEAAMHAGYDPPEAKYALGLALAALYREGVSEADRIHDKTLRAQRRTELKTQLRDPALTYLKAVGDATPDAPSSYAEGLVALYENDYATALARAAKAAEAAPFLYEAHELAGDAHYYRAKEAREKGAYADAAADIERAGTEYATAIAAAPSDATLLDAECRRRQSKLALARSMRTMERADLDGALEPCEHAHIADPDASGVLTREAFMLADAADYLTEHRGLDPSELVAHAQPLIDAALTIDPKSARAYHARAILQMAVARVKCDRREPCEADTDAAMTTLHRVIDLDPTYDDAYNDLAFLLQERGDREREAGHDPRKTLAEAVAIAERGIAASPRSEDLKGDLGSIWQARADYEAEHGVDPQESLGKSIAAFESALALNPNDASALNNMGLAIHTRGYYLLKHGNPEGEADLDRATKTYERILALGGTDSKVLNNIGYVDVDRAAHLAATDRDPKPAVADGLAYEQRALAANPNERFVFFNIAGMQLTQAEYDVEHGHDPTTAVAAAQKAIKSDLARSKEPDPDILAYESGTHVVAARWAMANKKSPQAEFAAAERSLERAEKLDANTSFVLGARIELERRKAEAQVAAGEDPSAALARARETVTKASESDHGSAAIHLWLGQLAAIEARGTKDAAKRAAAAETARKELAAAVTGNKFYERRAAALLAGL
jgi:serine/threonine-protein kinase